MLREHRRPRRSALPASVVIAVLAVAPLPVAAQRREPLTPSSFLIEEPSNQDSGGVQHIGAFSRGTGGHWAYSFTEEWPPHGLRQQLSYTLPVIHGNGTGVGACDGVMFDLKSTEQVALLLRGAGWTALTGLNLMLFSLLHNPCSTTIYTIYKETGSVRWTVLATALPLGLGFIVCFLTAQLWRLFA